MAARIRNLSANGDMVERADLTGLGALAGCRALPFRFRILALQPAIDSHSHLSGDRRACSLLDSPKRAELFRLKQDLESLLG
jgi:hypothetical protein